MNVKPLEILRTFTKARRLLNGMCWSQVAEQSGASYHAVKRAERGWWVTNSKDLFALLDWNGIRHHAVGAALVNGLNERLNK